MDDLQEQLLAKEAIETQLRFNAVEAELEAKKQQLRELAGGHILNIVVPGVGKVDVTAPRAGMDKAVLSVVEERLDASPELREKLIAAGVAKEVLVLDEDKLVSLPDLKSKLLRKGVIAEEIKKVSAAKASVRIQPNA